MSFVSIKSKKAPDAPPPVDLDLEVPTGELRVSDEAAERIRELKKTEVDAQFLRVGIAGGGCSGFSYTYAFEKEAKPTDLVFKNGDVAICVDPKSLKLIGGSWLHWQESMKRMGFQLINKKGRKSCSCGESFSL
jgi:iron-sulfur cluster assembly accessory protein